MRRSQRFFLAALAITGIVLTGLWGQEGGEKDNPKGVIAALRGHTDVVYTVAFSPDGNFLATGSFDRSIKLWDTSTAKEIRTFAGPTGHQNMVLSVAISPNGQLLASGGADNTLKLWDIPSRSPLRTLASNDAVNAIALSPDGKMLATAGKDGAVKLWNAADFKPLFNMTGHNGPVTGVAFSANGQILASSGADGSIRYWNPLKGQPIATLGAHSGSANAVAIHPNNTTAYSVGADGLLKFWQLAAPPARNLPAHAGPVHAMALSADGNQVLTGGDDKTVRLSALATAKETRVFAGATAPVHSLAFNSNATLVAAGTADSRIFLWNGADGKLIEQATAHRGAVTGLSFHPQNTQFLSGGADGLLKIWALPPLPGHTLAHPDGVLSASLTADGKRLFTGGADMIVRSWDLAKNAVERQFTGHEGAVTALVNSGNGQLLVSGSADATIRFWNQTTGKEAVAVGAHSGPVTSLALNPAGTQLLSSSSDGSVKVWQLPVAPPKPFVHPDPVTSVALNPDGSKLLTGCGDKLVRLWNLKSGAKERDFAGHSLAVTSVAFSRNGQLVAAGGADKSIHVWNTADAKPLKKIVLPAVVNALVFNPDGKHVVAGLADNSIRFVNLADGKEIKNLAGHKGAVSALAFTAKGDALLSASADKTVHIWSAAGEPKKKLDHVGPVTCLAPTADGSRLAAAAGKTIKVWNVADGKEIASIDTPTEIRSLSISPDAKLLVTGGNDKLARTYDFDGRLVEFFPHDGSVLAVTFVGPREVVTGSADKMARLWSRALVWQQTQKQPVRRALFSPKGDQVLAPSGKTVKFWNAADGKELRTLAAHDDVVVAIDLNNDGTRLATVGADKTVKIWNAKDDKKPAATFSLSAVPHTISLSPNGQRLAIGLEDQKTSLIRVFDTNQGRELQVIPDHQASVQYVAFQGDNRTLISAALDKTARFTDVGVQAALEAHAGGVVAAQFHSNGTQALSAGADKTIKLWDLAKGTVLKSFGPTADPVKAATFSRDYTLIGAAAGKTVKVWNLADGKELFNLAHPAEALSLSFSADKTRIATGSADNRTRVWDLATGKELQFFTQPAPVEAVVFDTKNTGILSAAGKIAQIDTLAIARVIPASTGPLFALGMTANGSHVLTGGADKLAKLWNTTNGANERTFAGAADAVKAVAIAKNNLLVAVGGADKAVRVHNFADAKELAAVKVAGTIQGLAFSPNSVALAAACSDKSLLTWDTTYTAGQPLPATFLKPIQAFSHPSPLPLSPQSGERGRGEGVTDVVFAADNATVYSSGLDKTVAAWKLASPAPIKNFPHPNIVDAVAFNPAGTLLASGAHDGKLRLFDLVKGVPLKEINAHPTANATMIYCVAFSPDGKQLVTAGFDNSLKLWDATTGALVREFKGYKVKEAEKGHKDSVFTAAFSPDGKFLASGSGGLERLVKIWKVADATVVRDLVNPNLKSPSPGDVHSHPGWVYRVAYTRDGKYLVSAGDAPMNKGYLAVWNPDDGKLLHGEALSLGTFFGLDIAADRRLAVGAGPRGRPTPEFNSAYLLQWPLQQK